MNGPRIVIPPPAVWLEVRQTCSLMECSNPHYARGWCTKHYARARKWPHLEPWVDSPERRFRERVLEDPETGCWLWQGNLTTRGQYAEFGIGERSTPVHRWAYEQFIDEIPAGLHLDHLCRVHHCVNPWHLDPVPFQENIARGVGPSARAIREDVCQRGHAFTEENTYRWTDGSRNCRTCAHERYLSRRERAAS